MEKKIINLDSKNTLEAFLYLIYKGDIDIVKLLIDNGFNLNQYSKDEDITPLAQAISKNNIGLIKLFLENNIDVTFHKNIAINKACTGNKPNLDTIKFLLEKGATLNEDCIYNLQKSNNPDIKKFLKDYTTTDMSKICPNYDSLEESNIILFNIEGSKQCVCITYSEWKILIIKQEVHSSSKLLTFKLPFSNVYIQSTYNTLHKNDTFKLIKLDEKQLVLSGKLEEVYSVMPIKRQNMLKEITGDKKYDEEVDSESDSDSSEDEED